MLSLKSLDKRSIVKEFMDDADIQEKDLEDNFRFIKFINRYGGGHRVVIKALEELLIKWPKDKPVEILDVGCGIGDIAMAISRWGKAKGLDIRYLGLDRNSRILKLARAQPAGNNIRYMKGDLSANDIPEADFVIASMLLHHLWDEDVPRSIMHLFRSARSALIINDLRRSILSYFLCYLLTRFVKNEVSRNDALLSVRKGFRLEEIRSLLDKLNINGIVKKEFGFRFSLIMAKTIKT